MGIPADWLEDFDTLQTAQQVILGLCSNHFQCDPASLTVEDMLNTLDQMITSSVYVKKL